MDRNTRIIILWGIAFAIAIVTIVLDESIIIPEKDKTIRLLNQTVFDQEKLLMEMNEIIDERTNATLSTLDAIRSAEVDNFTMANQISAHCFFKITGENQSLERCYGQDIVDERIQACMTGHDIMALYMNEVPLNKQANNSTCTEMVKNQK